MFDKTEPGASAPEAPLDARGEQVTWRTPGRKLTKEDLSATAALIMGCTCQKCCDGDPSGPAPEEGTVS